MKTLVQFYISIPCTNCPSLIFQIEYLPKSSLYLHTMMFYIPPTRLLPTTTKMMTRCRDRFFSGQRRFFQPHALEKNPDHRRFFLACILAHTASAFATPHKSSAWLMPPCGDPFSSTQENTPIVSTPPFFSPFISIVQASFQWLWQKSELIGWLDSLKRSP